jgi:copper(I)-binding protein
VTVSDAFILGGQDSQPLAKGSSASMFLGVYNGSYSSDKLISVDVSSVAKSVELTGGSIAVPGQSSADLEGPKPKVVLRDLSKSLSSGQTVDVLLTFANAGSVELTVPVEARTAYYSTYSPPAPTPSATTSTSATPSGTATPSPSTSTSATATPTPSATP